MLHGRAPRTTNSPKPILIAMCDAAAIFSLVSRLQRFVCWEASSPTKAMATSGTAVDGPGPSRAGNVGAPVGSQRSTEWKQMVLQVGVRT